MTMNGELADLDRLFRKLESIGGDLADADKQKLRHLPMRRLSVAPGGTIVREGASLSHCSFLLGGFACRYKTLPDKRQIVAIHTPGDILNLDAPFLDKADYAIDALGKADIARVPRDEILQLFDNESSLRRLLTRDLLVDAAIVREWVVNVGQRSAAARIAHLLCEIAVRCEVVGVAHNHVFPLPLTQAELGDATGMTIVHVNRTLKLLREQGLVTIERRVAKVLDWDGLAALAGFDPAYLHQD